MQIKTAIITAAGKSQRTLPLQTLVDQDGQTKAALRIIVEEVLSAGIQDIGVVVCPGDQEAYRAAAGPHADRLQFVEQKEALGYGHAIYSARELTNRQPFLLLVGDHLYVSNSSARCAQQLVELAASQSCSVSAVQATHESKLPYYGAIGGKLAQGTKGLFEVANVLEKPSPTEAEQTLAVPGLRAGHYLCFFGMHVLTPAVMDLLQETGSTAAANQAREAGEPGGGGRFRLSTALSRLAARERYLACELQGRRYDIGVKFGLWTAQLALALEGADQNEILSLLVDLLAKRQAQNTQSGKTAGADLKA